MYKEEKEPTFEPPVPPSKIAMVAAAAVAMSAVHAAFENKNSVDQLQPESSLQGSGSPRLSRQGKNIRDYKQDALEEQDSYELDDHHGSAFETPRGSIELAAVKTPEPPPPHPLEGVAHFLELPLPDELGDRARDTAEQSGLIALLGLYRTQCFFSRVWALREAALTKTRLLLEAQFLSNPGLTECLSALSTMVRIGVDDKIHQVLVVTVGLLGDLLRASRRFATNNK